MKDAESIYQTGAAGVTTAVRPSRLVNVPMAATRVNGDRQPEVAVALGYLQRELMEAHEQMQALEERLTGVMRASEPAAPKESSGEGFSSGLATAIQQEAGRARQVKRRLEEMLNRLEV